MIALVAICSSWASFRHVEIKSNELLMTGKGRCDCSTFSD